MKYSIYSIFFILIFLSGCAKMPEAVSDKFAVAKENLKASVSYVKRTKIINDPKVQKNLKILKEQSIQVLTDIGLLDYINKYVGHPDKRFIQRNEANEDIYTASGEKVLITSERETQYYAMIDEIAARYNVPPARVYAVIRAESGFNDQACSPVGAQGLMQLMPKTAESLGVKNSLDARDNIMGGTRYLSILYGMYGDWDLTHAAYNAGPGNVKKYGNKIPPFKETQDYVVRVSRYYTHYSSEGESIASIKQ